MWQRETDIRLTFNKCQTPVPEISEAKAIEALMFKVQEQMRMSRKLQAIQLNFNAMQRAQMEGMEQSKISNRLEEKYGIDNEGLELAEWYYNLEANPKVQSFLKLAQAQ